jgi:hypothetical protein
MKAAAAPGGRRTLWLGAALLASLLAAQWVSGEEGAADLEAVAEETSPRKPGRVENDTPKEKEREKERGGNELLRLDRLESRKFSAQAGDLFRSQSWAPPPPPPSEAEKNRPPAPPPLQFKYLGKIIEDEETQVFLSLAERNYVVKPGENINAQYRLDEVSDHGITVTYLPLNAKQMLATAPVGEIR